MSRTSKRRLTQHLARLGVRATRHRLRGLRRPRPPRHLEVGVGGLRLAPVTRRAAEGWIELTATERPPAEGLAASPLGGAARTRRQWLARGRTLRRHIRRGDQRGYLVEQDGVIVGEALAFLDGGTELAELVVWLADVPSAQAARGPVIAAMAADLLDHDVRRAMFTARAGDAAATEIADRHGFTREGTLSDPPFVDRDVFVRHRTDRRQGSAVGAGART